MSDFPPRALKWALEQMPKPLGRTITLFEQNVDKNKYSALAYLKRNKEAYYAYLSENGLEQNTYDKTITWP